MKTKGIDTIESLKFCSRELSFNVSFKTKPFVYRYGEGGGADGKDSHTYTEAWAKVEFWFDGSPYSVTFKAHPYDYCPMDDYIGRVIFKADVPEVFNSAHGGCVTDETMVEWARQVVAFAKPKSDASAIEVREEEDGEK